MGRKKEVTIEVEYAEAVIGKFRQKNEERLFQFLGAMTQTQTQAEGSHKGK